MQFDVEAMKRLSSVLLVGDKLSYWSGLLAALFIVLMVLLVSYEVILRYVFKRAPMVADEFSAYLLVACIFIGLAYTMKEKGHIKVEVVVSRLAPEQAHWLRLFTLIVCLLTVGIFFWESVQLVFHSYDLGRRSQTWLLTPTYLVQIVMPIGFFLFFLQVLAEISKTVRGYPKLGFGSEK